jgi:hypothetical protein
MDPPAAGCGLSGREGRCSLGRSRVAAHCCWRYRSEATATAAWVAGWGPWRRQCTTPRRERRSAGAGTRWHRRIVRRHWTDPAPARGRPPLPDSVQTVIVRLATENPRWGDQRIRGELLPLGRWASGSSIAGSCAPPPSSRHQLELPGPGPRRSFLGRQAAGILACDFLTVDTAFRQPRSVLVFIHCTIGASTSPASPPTPPVPGWPSKPQPRRRAG